MDVIALVIALVLLASVGLFAMASVRSLRMAALGEFGRLIAIRNMKTLRVSKLEKPCVALITLQKSGSTLLCYACALLNTRNSINRFRNDFDILPMLSFGPRFIKQNFNARQDGKFQMYKINARLMDMDAPLQQLGIHKTVWMCREFDGYYRSMYWWLREFYARASRVFATFRLVGWSAFKAMTLREVAKHHVEELWYAYNRCKSSDPADILFLSYEHLTLEKSATLRALAAWLGVDCSDEMVQSIAAKTSKTSMSEGDRFDPVSFGDGVGVSKVNLAPHSHSLHESDMKIYDSIFAAKFAEVGIASYAQLIDELRRMQLARHDSAIAA